MPNCADHEARGNAGKQHEQHFHHQISCSYSAAPSCGTISFLHLSIHAEADSEQRWVLSTLLDKLPHHCRCSGLSAKSEGRGNMSMEECGWELVHVSGKGAECMQIGMHYMNPVVTMKLVELIRGIATSEEVRLP